MSTNSNGQGVIEKPQTMPAFVSVVLDGITITAPAAIAQGTGNIWYEAVLDGEIEDGTTIEQALLAATCSFEGEALEVGKRNRDEVTGKRQVAISQPRKYKKGHAKEGQIVPNTGGNQTLSFVKQLPTWGERGYQLRVTLTGVETNGVRRITVGMACQTMLPKRARRQVGTASGPLKFGA